MCDSQPRKAKLKLGASVKIRYEKSVFVGVLSKITPSVIYLAKTHEVLPGGGSFSISGDDELIAFARNAIEFLEVKHQEEDS